MTKGSDTKFDGFDAPGSTDLFRIQNGDDDGLLFSRIEVLDSSDNVIKYQSKFWDVFGTYCKGCSWGFCDRCWVDNEGHGECHNMLTDTDDKSFSCL